MNRGPALCQTQSGARWEPSRARQEDGGVPGTLVLKCDWGTCIVGGYFCG